VTLPLTVAVVIPFYNGSSFIRRAVASVQAQTRPVDDVVIVNDGSSPAETAFIAEFAAESGIRLVHQANAGQSAARNVGAGLTATSHLCFLDQDDYFTPTHVEVLESVLVGSADAALDYVYGDADRVDMSGRVVYPRIATSRSLHPKSTLRDFVAEDAFILPSASMVSRRLFESVGGFEPALRGYEDDDFFLRAFLGGFTGRFVNESVLGWTLNPESSSHSPRMAESRFIYLERLSEMLSVRSQDEQQLLPTVVYPRFLRSFAFELVHQRSIGSVSNRPSELFVAAERIARTAYSELPRETRRLVSAIRLFAELSVQAQIIAAKVIVSWPIRIVRRVAAVAIGRSHRH
jgi:glycosyltransferase involved in cell wall biosynthesis